MNKFALLAALAMATSACMQPKDDMVEAAVPAPEAATTSMTETAGEISEPVTVASNVGTTVSGGSGSTCLAVDVLANDGAFIRAGTAGSLSGDVFTVNGASHDMSGINYSVKPC